MVIIKNKIIPFGKFKAINIFGIIFYKGSYPRKDRINHENIHTAQMKEMLYIFFYVWYAIEWFIKLFKYNFTNAYLNVSFEKEANMYRYDTTYLNTRKHYSWFKLI